MSEPAHTSRTAIDLDDLERQLRSVAAPEARAVPNDPLAELARLVGQDDPLKAMFANRSPAPAVAPPQPSSAPAATAAPVWPEAPLRASLQDEAAAPAVAPPSDPHDADLRGALDEFDAIFQPGRAASAPQVEAVMPATYQPMHAHAYPAGHEAPPVQSGHQAMDYDDPIARDLDRVLQEQRSQQSSAYAPVEMGAQDQGYAPAGYGYEDEPAAEAPPARRLSKSFIAAAALIGVAVVGVAGAAVWRGAGKSAGGEAPTIKADAGPTKVQPVNPGGTDIPDQNKAIYERNNGAAPTETKIVNNNEQPIDVQAATRAQPRVVGPGATAPNGVQPDVAASAAQSSANALNGLGEPRKVRTVAIRPDGTVIGSSGPAPAVASAPVNISPPAQLQQQAQAAPVPPSGRPDVNAAPASTPATTPASAPGASSSTAVLRQQAPKPPVKTQGQVAAAPPIALQPRAQTPATPAPEAEAQTATAEETPAAEPRRSAGSGDFVVQLGAPGSEQEARSTFASLQRRFPDELGGERALIRKADLAGGKTVYRLRVGPFSRDEASTLCTKLQGRGGQCYVARN